MRFALGLFLAASFAFTGCAEDGVTDDDDDDDDDDVTDGGQVDAPEGTLACDMTGVWIAQQFVTSVALGSDQNTTTWYYYEFTQTGDTFTAVASLNCGLVVDGTTTVTIDDATLEALAPNEVAGPGRGGTFVESAIEGSCDFALDRMYNLRGAVKSTYLTDDWNVGDPGKALTEFEPLPTEPPGMEDWDDDGMHGITLRSGLGNRYVAQRDWNEHAGVVPQFANEFGGEGVITVMWDSQEGISDQTPALLRVTATPDGNGWARYARVGDQLEVVDGNPLETCRNVQDLASEVWP